MPLSQVTNLCFDNLTKCEIMQIELITKQDFENFKRELLEALAAFTDKKTPAKEGLRSKEVRQMLKISNGTLMNLRVKKLLNPTKIQGVFYFKLSEIEALLNAGTEL